MTFSLGEYQDIFLEEADEQLQELNQNLLELEKNPDNDDIINNIFRAAHSLKSSAAFVGLNDLSDLAHKMENLLQGIRDKTMQVTPTIVDVLFSCFDVISSVIDTVGSGKKPEQDLSEIIARIRDIGEDVAAASPAERPGKAAPEIENIPKTKLTAAQMRQVKDGLESGISCCEVIVFVDPSAQMKWIKAQLVHANLEKIAAIVALMPSLDALRENNESDVFKMVILTTAAVEDVRRACGLDQVIRIDLKRISLSKNNDKMVLKFHEKETLFSEEVREGGTSADYLAEKEVDDDEEEEYKIETIRRKDGRKTTAIKIVKVSVDKLDLLLNNVGELVIANSGFFRLYEEMRKANFDKSITNEFKNRMDQMSRIAKDLQGGIMKTRMVPVGQVFSRFNRLVRDLAKEFGKLVTLQIKGEETELDKKVIDAIGEPLMHLIRNAIDHGVETAEERRKLGKPDVAMVALNAYQSGNQIFVEVSDDGRGLNASRIKKKVLEKGLASPEMLANMDNEEVYNFIYNPGFSTTDVVTDISGRGVGMNVVKEIVSELNGNVTIETEPGMGTRFLLSFPLTLAIIPAIMVKVRHELYAIPLSDVIETIKISYADMTTIEGHEVINLRGEILSLLRLNEFVGTESGIEDDRKVPVVVVGYGNRKIGLIVDHLEGKQEIVIKSLEQNYANVEGLSGASILGDGSICLILDIASMINRVITDQDRLSRMQRQRVVGQKSAQVEEIREITDLQRSATEKREKDLREPAIKKETAAPAPRAKDISQRKEAVRTENAPVEKIKEDIIFERRDTIPAAPSKAVPASAPAKSAMKAGEDESAIEAKVRDVLRSFKDELKDSIRTTVESGEPDGHIKKSLGITEEDMERVQVLANVGITNAAESLSKILGKQIDLSIPTVELLPVEKVPENFGEVDNVYIGVYMPLVGDIKGTILFGLAEEAGFELIDMLYGIESGKTRELDEDGESALKEVTNIVGSSVVNVISEKTAIAIKPTVPTVVHDFMQSILDSILVLHNISNDYVLVMDTEFYYQNDRVIGKLMVLPETESLKKIVERLR
ncbi:MAG: chemotaxis protein CheW [Spirochaetes bacterium]|jgi:two-component system chemotaxis sensor kinase CheA|nr:chemotaxis protein CheW [Spirochaetota bacterium]